MRQDHKIVICFILVIGFLIYNEFDTKIIKQYDIVQEGNKAVYAEFSEEDCGMTFDMEGNPDYSCDASSWSEQVSKTWSFTAINGEVTSTNAPKKISNNNGHVELIGFPLKTISHSKNNFDGYSNRSNVKYYIQTKDKTYHLNKDSYKEMLSKNGDVATVKVWYGKVRSVKIN